MGLAGDKHAVSDFTVLVSCRLFSLRDVLFARHWFFRLDETNGNMWRLPPPYCRSKSACPTDLHLRKAFRRAVSSLNVMRIFARSTTVSMEFTLVFQFPFRIMVVWLRKMETSLLNVSMDKMEISLQLSAWVGPFFVCRMEKCHLTGTNWHSDQ